MPTGYTEPVYNGKPIDAANLAALFARGLGFTIHQRDEWITSPPRKREPSDYSKRRVTELEEERARLLDLSQDEAEAEFQAHVEEVDAYNADSRERHRAMRRRYLDAIRVFNSWSPRTEAGQKVEEFALKQLKEAMDFDASPGGPYMRPYSAGTAEEYIVERLAENARSLDSARQSLYDEEVRCNEVNRWVDDFYADVKLLDGIRLNQE